MKVIKVATLEDVNTANDYTDVVDWLMFDAKAPISMTDALPGGNGIAFDWQALTGVKGGASFMLSGGLTSDNVASAIAATGATIVDVSSGVESAPGEKDVDLIRSFIAAATRARGILYALNIGAYTNKIG